MVPMGLFWSWASGRSSACFGGLLGGSWVVISRVTILITHTHEPPSRDRRGQTPNAELELSRVGFGCDYFEPLSANRQPTASIFGWLSKLWSLFGYPRY